MTRSGEMRVMNRRAVLVGMAATVGSSVLAACGGTDATPSIAPRIVPSPSPVPMMVPQGPAVAACGSGTLAIAGSTALQPLVDAAAKTYAQKCSGARITVEGGGSSVGLGRVQNSQVQIGMSDIFAEEQKRAVSLPPNSPPVTIDAKQLQDFQLIVQGFAIVTNKVGGPDTLTRAQLLSVFTGKTTNFRDVGGPNQGITVVTREQGSGTRATLERYGLDGQVTIGQEMDSTGKMVAAVQQTPGAIGYVSLAALATNKDLKLVLLDGREPSVENISDNSYPIWSYGHLYTKAASAAMPSAQTKTLTQAFLDYLLSDDVQTTLVPQLGYIPASRVKSRKTP